jgi:protein SCO1/2
VIPRNWLGRALLGGALACGFFGYLRPVLGSKHTHHAPQPLPAELGERSLYRLGASFQTDSAKAFRLPELRGNFQVLALVFTRCPSVCPTLVHEMLTLERSMPTDVSDATRFTLISIDPAHDTPEALRAYRSKLGLDPEHWILLRGEDTSVRDLSALLGFSYSGGSGMPFAHSKQVTILNRDGEIIHQQESVSADPQKIIDAIERAL